MYSVTRSALVAHRAEDMYSLVNDIDSYHAFLPWCDASAVLERGDFEMLARVHIAYRGVRKSFTTRNRLTPHARIDLGLVDGPFNALTGAWAFKELRADACRISLDLQFDIRGPAGLVIGPVFKRIADSLVDSFVARAAEVYGRDGDLPRHPRSLLSGGGRGDGDADGGLPRHPRSLLSGGGGDGDAKTIRAEVVYAEADVQTVEALECVAPVTVGQAIHASGILRRFPHINLSLAAVGVFGIKRPLDWRLTDGDRVEIYRPLAMSPTEARRQRQARAGDGDGDRDGDGDVDRGGDGNADRDG